MPLYDTIFGKVWSDNEPVGEYPEDVRSYVLTESRKLKIAETKGEAQRRIYALVPQWKQVNLTARAVELHQKRLDLVALTQDEQIEVAAIQTLWDKVKAIRAASDLIEADIRASANPTDFDVEGNPTWPT